VEEYLEELITEEETFDAEQEDGGTVAGEAQSELPIAELSKLPSADDEALVEKNVSTENWISRNGHQRREQKGIWYRRKADFLANRTDPDSSPMKRRERKPLTSTTTITTSWTAARRGSS